MNQPANEIEQTSTNLNNSDPTVIAEDVNNQPAVKKPNRRIVSILLAIILISFSVFLVIFTFTQGIFTTKPNSPSPSPSVEPKTSQLAILEGKVDWLATPQEVSTTSVEVKPIVNLFDLKSDDSLRIFKVGSFSDGIYKSFTLYSMYYGQGMMSFLSGASGAPITRFAYDERTNKYVIFANSSCDLLPPFDDWQIDNMRTIKEYLVRDDVDQSKLIENTSVEWNGIEGIPDRVFCGKSTEIVVRDQPFLIYGPYPPELKISHNNENIVGESTVISGVKIYRRPVSEKPTLADYEDIYYGIGKDGSYYYVKQKISFDSLNYSKYPLARNGNTLANDSNDYGSFRIVGATLTNPQSEFKTINSNLATLEIDQNSLESVATDSNGNIFYAIKKDSVLANSFYMALGSTVDEAGQTISQDEFIRCFPILIAKNRLGDMQVYYSGYAFAEIPQQFSTGRAIYTPNIFQVQK